jgi:hypothetical protein
MRGTRDLFSLLTYQESLSNLLTALESQDDFGFGRPLVQASDSTVVNLNVITGSNLDLIAEFLVTVRVDGHFGRETLGHSC